MKELKKKRCNLSSKVLFRWCKEKYEGTKEEKMQLKRQGTMPIVQEKV